MPNYTLNLENPRAPKPPRTGGQPAGVHWTRTEAGQRESLKILGMEIAQTAIQSIGMSTKDPWGPPIRLPQYALAVSIIFTKATNQTIILNTPPEHACSSSILWISLAHDKRFEQVPMSQASPGDILIEPGWQKGADGYAGIVVDQGGIVSNSSQGVQNNSSLANIQRSHPGMIAFRYVGFWNYYRSKALANAGFDPNETRLPAGQSGGGQWTNGDATAAARADAARKFAHLAEVYSEKANDEDELAGPTALVFDGVGQPDEQDRHKLAAKEARDIAAEMQRRAYILTHGTKDNYRQLVVDQYGINNPDLNGIMAYYAKKFNDQATLNWLKQQHPATPPSPDQIRKDVGMMALLPEFEKMSEAAGESPLTGKAPEKGVFEKASDIEGRASREPNNVQGDVELRELTPAEQKTYARVEPRQSTRNAIQEKYTDEDGKFRDAVTKDKIEPGSPWVMGHKPGFEFRKMQVDAANRGISREQFIEEQNNPNLYQPELPGTSSRRVHEAPEHIQLPPGAAGTSHENKY